MTCIYNDDGVCRLFIAGQSNNHVLTDLEGNCLYEDEDVVECQSYEEEEFDDDEDNEIYDDGDEYDYDD